MTNEERERTLGRELIHQLDNYDNGLAQWARHHWDNGMPIAEVAAQLRRANRICEVLRIAEELAE